MKSINLVVELPMCELVDVRGGHITKDSSFGHDVGFIIGWVFSAMGKGASAIYG